MSSAIDDSFLNFDLSLLQVNPHIEVEGKTEKQRKAIIQLKKKAISIEEALKKVRTATKDVHDIEKQLSVSTDENKEIRIQYKRALDKTRKLQKDLELAHHHVRELQEKLDVSVNQYQAMQSHANQLQQLVHDCETQIESLKIENKLAKANTKELTNRTRHVQLQKNEYEVIINDLCILRDVVLGKKKLRTRHKIILKKYEKLKSNTDDNDSSSDCSIDDIENIYEPTPSPLSTVLLPNNRIQQVQRSFAAIESNKNICNDHDYDSNNEVVSEDTGRGSSLASLGSEKCINSPDYFIDNSPLSNGMIKDKRNFNDMSTSPITVLVERSDACTSPLSFSYMKKTIDQEIQVHSDDLITKRNVATSPLNVKVQEKATEVEKSDACTSPVPFSYMKKQTIHAGIQVHLNDLIVKRNAATSPRKTKVQERATSPLQIQDRALSPMEKNVERVPTPIPKTPQKKAQTPINHIQQEKGASLDKESLELDNSKVSDDNQDSDCEVENILRSVRLDYNLITPIPKSPAKVQINDNTQSCRKFICPDTATLAKDFEQMKATICTLSNFLFSKPWMRDDKMKHTSNGFQDNNTAIPNFENIMPILRETCKSVESSLTNPVVELNIVSNPKLLDHEVSSATDKVQNKHQNNNDNLEHNIPSQECIIKSPITIIDKLKKTKKLTRLEKLRKKLLPRSKIRRDLAPSIRKINKRTPLLFKKRILEHSAIAPEKNKLAYENAVKVMAELKTKEKNKPINTAPCKDAVKLNTMEHSTTTLQSNENARENAVKVMAELKTKDKDEPINSAPCKDAVKLNTMEHSTTTLQSNDIACENAVKVMAELKTKDKDEPIRSAPCKDAVKLNSIEHSATTIQSNEIAYENAVIVMAELKTKEKDKPIKSAPCKDAVKLNTMEHSTTAPQNNKIKVMADVKAEEKNKPITPAPCQVAVNKLITKEVRVVLTKCNGLIAQNKNISTVASEKGLTLIKSCEKPTTVVDIVSYPYNAAKTSISEFTAKVDNSQTPSVSRCSKRLSSSVSNSSNVSNNFMLLTEEDLNEPQSCKRFKSVALDKTKGPCKKISTPSQSALPTNNTNNIEVVNSPNNIVPKPIEYRRKSARLSTSHRKESQINKGLENQDTTQLVTYNDLDIFSKEKPHEEIQNTSDKASSFKDSILCKMIQKHAISVVKWNPKKLPETTVNYMCKKLEDTIAKILLSSTSNSKEVTDNFVKEISNGNMKVFLAGLMKYLKDPERKNEMYSKVSILNSPPMTKSERVMIYVVKQLQFAWPNKDFVEVVLTNIEYALFKLNHTPEFGTVESMSHFYAVLCRYFGKLSRLRLLMIDAMYCVQFKCVSIIKQCMEVWMHILPLNHLGLAKTPIVTCLVYLLHFFKCEDKFKRVDEIRHILSRKYHYKIYEMTESNVLETLQNAINKLSDIEMERKMLRLALIIVAKRKGPTWCQKNIVNNMLLPLIHKDGVPDKIKEFCVSILGRLLKPYPNTMKSDSEIIFNQLIDMLEKNVSHTMKEAIFSSLLFMRHKPAEVQRSLLLWNPGTISAEFEQILANYIREKPAKVWIKQLTTMTSNRDKYD